MERLVETKSIRITIFVSVFLVILISMLATGLVWYLREVEIREKHILEKSGIALQPIQLLAERNIDGNNLVQLKNAQAQALYDSTPNLLFIQMIGTSLEQAATEQSDKIESQEIEYHFIKQGFNENWMKSLIVRIVQHGVNKEDYILDSETGFLILNKDLNTANKGTIKAVFLADELENIWLEVLKQLAYIYVFVLTGAVFVALYLGNRISSPIIQAAKQLTQITRSLDLVSQVKVDTKNEIGELAHWFNNFSDRLRQILTSVKQFTFQGDKSATKIIKEIQNQSSISIQQTTSITEITTTLEELSSASAHISNNSQSVVTASESAFNESKRGREAIETMKDKMDEIKADNENSAAEIVQLEKKSKEITRVMEIIDDIADQTKMIAFNAALEASSAGKYGDRFGVVAGEIRRLAENVTTSTREIRTKIQEIQNATKRLVTASSSGASTIEEGAKLANNTLDELSKLVEGAKTNFEAANKISVSTQQQQMATGQALNSLKEIEKGLHESSNSLKQTAGVTSGLTESYSELKKLLGSFKIENNSNQQEPKA
jgi:methyl-accepting chemotaxis protein